MPNRKITRFIGFCSVILYLFISAPAWARNKADGKLVDQKQLQIIHSIGIYDITYYSDGLKVKALLYLPPVKKGTRIPVVVFCHDGTNGISKEHELSSLRIAEQGYAVFCPSYRGEIASYREKGKPTEKMQRSEGEIEIAKGEVRDTLNAIKLLKHTNWANNKRILLMGASHGALISVIAASRNNNVKGVISAYGVMDIYKWWEYLKKNNKIGNDIITRRTYGKGPEDRPQSFAVRNGVSYAKFIDCPVLLLQGSKDDIVPEEQAKFMHNALINSGKKSELLIYPSALHGFLVYAPYDPKADPEEKKQTESAWKTVFKFMRENLSR